MIKKPDKSMKRLQGRPRVHVINGQVESENRVAAPSHHKFPRSFAQVTHHPSKQLSVAQAHHKASDGDRARFILRPDCPHDFEDQVLGDKMVNLTEGVKFGVCWAERFIFHPSLVAGLKRRPSIFFLSLGGRL